MKSLALSACVSSAHSGARLAQIIGPMLCSLNCALRGSHASCVGWLLAPRRAGRRLIPHLLAADLAE